MVGVNQTVCIEGTTLAENGPSERRFPWQVRLQQFSALCQIATVNDTQRSGCGEFRPVNCLSKPLEIVPEEFIVRRALVHEGVAEGDCGVEYRVSAFQTIPNFVQYAEVGVIVSEEEFQVQSNGLAAVQDLAYPVENLILCIGQFFRVWRICLIVGFIQKLVGFRGYI